MPEVVSEWKLAQFAQSWCRQGCGRGRLRWRGFGFGLLGLALLLLGLIVVRFLTNFCPAWAVSSQLAVLVNDHYGIRAGRNVHIRTFLDSRSSSQFYVPGRGRVSRFVRSPNCARWRATARIRPLAHQANIPFGYRFLQTLIFSLCNKHGQFVRLKIETWISHLHSAAKDAHVLGRIKKRFVSVNFRRCRFVGVQTLGALAEQLISRRFVLFLGVLLLRWFFLRLLRLFRLLCWGSCNCFRCYRDCFGYVRRGFGRRNNGLFIQAGAESAGDN